MRRIAGTSEETCIVFSSRPGAKPLLMRAVSAVRDVRARGMITSRLAKELGLMPGHAP